MGQLQWGVIKGADWMSQAGIQGKACPLSVDISLFQPFFPYVDNSSSPLLSSLSKPSHAMQGSFWKCQLRSALNAPPGPTPLAAAFALMNSTTSLLASRAWPPTWTTGTMQTMSSPAMGEWQKGIRRANGRLTRVNRMGNRTVLQLGYTGSPTKALHSQSMKISLDWCIF